MNKGKNITIIWPIVGIVLFVLLYFVASLFYPGGSQFDKGSIGFSWFHNYWCNLLNPIAINDMPNHARPYAMMAHIVLCFSILFFYWSVVPHIVPNRHRYFIRISALISCIISLLLMTNLDHDLVSNWAALFNVVSLTITMINLWKNQYFCLFYSGIFNFVIFVINATLYYHQEWIYFLPIVQKLSFAYFLLWICMVCLFILRKVETKQITMIDYSH